MRSQPSTVVTYTEACSELLSVPSGSFGERPRAIVGGRGAAPICVGGSRPSPVFQQKRCGSGTSFSLLFGSASSSCNSSVGSAQWIKSPGDRKLERGVFLVRGRVCHELRGRFSPKKAPLNARCGNSSNRGVLAVILSALHLSSSAGKIKP